jgi:uncharacterized protein (TIGR02246 family)
MNKTAQHRPSCVAAPWWAIAVLALLTGGVVLYRTATADEKQKVEQQGANAESAASASEAAASQEPAIRATAAAFIAAFNEGDARGIATLWTPAGSLTDETGAVFKGREAIEKEYAASFKQNPGARLSLRIESITFPTPAVAIEDGVAQVVIFGGEAPAASRYSAVHVLHDGQWQMASVRESPLETPSNFGRIQELAFLVGDWKTTRDDTTVQMSFRWIAGRSFLQQAHTVTRDGIVTASGTQIIGWDPETGRFRSWSFDSTGGYGQSLWTELEDGWRLESRGILASGTLTSSRDFLIRAFGEDQVLGWRSIDRQVGSESLPNTDEVVLDRVTR